MIEIEQKVTKAEYIKAVTIHYFGYKYTLINPVLGLVILILLSMAGIIVPEMINPSFYILLALSVYLLLRPLIYIQSVYQAAKSSKSFFEPTQITITDEEKISASANGDETSVYLKNLYAYYNTKDFIYLYYSKAQYLLLNKRYMEPRQVKEVVSIIKQIGVRSR